MKKLKLFLPFLLVLCATHLLAKNTPDFFHKNKLAQITKVEFSYETGFGDHEFKFFIEYPFKENKSTSYITIWDKASFAKCMRWREGDFIYIDRDLWRAYHLNTKNWVHYNEG